MSGTKKGKSLGRDQCSEAGKILAEAAEADFLVRL